MLIVEIVYRGDGFMILENVFSVHFWNVRICLFFYSLLFIVERLLSRISLNRPN